MKNISSILKAALLFVILALFVGTAALADEKQGEKKEVAEKKVTLEKEVTMTEAEAEVSEITLPTAAEFLRRKNSSGTAMMNTAVPATMQPQEQKQGGQGKTGTDPRDFGSKFMPYYRLTTLKNEVESQGFVLFGMWAMGKKFALTYEFFLQQELDITKTEACAGLPDSPCLAIPGAGSPLLPNGLPAEGDGKEVGMGDGNIRLFANVGNLLGGQFIPGIEIGLPMATDPVLGSETAWAGPIITFVWDFPLWPAPGSFFAMMNIFQFDIFKDSGRGDIARYLGRWFFMLPLHKALKLYALVEMQPVYDFENEHFSFWLGPEIGKALGPGGAGGVFSKGGAVYIKPGFGISPDSVHGDRETSFEFGFRYFL